jgi:CDP-diacylglycerol--serine O-phosphatidyltransferase
VKPITSFIPNTITCLNLLSGCLAVVCAFHLDSYLWGLPMIHWAFIFIGAAAIFDFCDGLSARTLHAYSPMGKELDSLSDLVSFGLAPAFLVMNTMAAQGGPVWTPWTALLIALAGALRLAKFNVDTRQTTSFIGLPIPANAIFWIGALAWLRDHAYPGDIVMIILIVLFSYLMVSEIKMFSLKFSSLAFRQNARRYLVLGASILMVITDGISALAWSIILYILISLLGKKTDPDSQESHS